MKSLKKQNEMLYSMAKKSDPRRDIKKINNINKINKIDKINNKASKKHSYSNSNISISDSD